jgi:hypothetical protein
MADLATWALVDVFTARQAACLWVGAEPKENLWFPNGAQKDQIAAIEQMLTGAILLGVLHADASANIQRLIGDHSKTMVTREALRALAESKNQRPAFLFDTLLPQKAKHRDDVSDDDTAPSQIARSRGGRPPEYDWDALTIEIIRIADLDGLPEKQSELKEQLLQWCENTWGKQPAESSVKSRISDIYNGLGRGKNR